MCKKITSWKQCLDYQTDESFAIKHGVTVENHSHGSHVKMTYIKDGVKYVEEFNTHGGKDLSTGVAHKIFAFFAKCALLCVPLAVSGYCALELLKIL